MASIRDVARASGVSTATVSNVLNGRSEKVGQDTRDKVLAAVRALKYRPTAFEHQQQAILSQNLGVMVPDLTEGPLVRHGYFRNVLDGVLEAAAMRGWSVTVFVQTMWDDVGHAVRRSYDGRCDGLIMVAPQPGNEVVQMLCERGTPLVLVGTTPWVNNVSSVDVDNRQIGENAARILVELKHSRLAYIGHEHEQVSSVERREAFFLAARKAGIDPDRLIWIRLPRSDSASLDAEMAIRELLLMAEKPTGLFCWHDGLGVPIVSELRRGGILVPDEISIVSVDDDPAAATTDPPLSTFTNPLHDIGKRAAKMIIDRLSGDGDGDAVETVRYASELKVRASIGPAKVVAGAAR